MELVMLNRLEYTVYPRTDQSLCRGICMRSIFVGVEYAGKSTLIDLLGDYYRQRKVRIHAIDHFTIPDSTLSAPSREIMVGLPEDIKERMQRMQIHYHVDIIKNAPVR